MPIDPELEAYILSTEDLAVRIRTDAESIDRNMAQVRRLTDVVDPDPDPTDPTPRVGTFTATPGNGTMTFAWTLLGELSRLDSIGVGVGTDDRFITWNEYLPVDGTLVVTDLTARDVTCGADIHFRFANNLSEWVMQSHVEASVQVGTGGGGGGGTPDPDPGPATGAFTISDGKWFDPEGQLFVPRGFMAVGGDATWNVWHGYNLHQDWETMVGAPYYSNFFRLIHTERSDFAHHPYIGSLGSLDELCARAQREKVVLMLTNFDNSPGWGSVYQPYIDHAATKMARLAARYKDNPYVWYSPFNEPTESGYGPANVDLWLAYTEPVVAAIRNVAPNAMIVCCGEHYGQERSNAPISTDPVLIQPGAIQYLRNRYGGPIAGDAHMYARWRNQDASDADMNFYLTRLREMNIPLVWGEVGAAWEVGNEVWEGPERLYRALATHTHVGAAPWGEDWWGFTNPDAYRVRQLHKAWVDRQRDLGH